VIATRQLTQDSRLVTIEIDRPRRISDAGDFACDFRIDGLASGPVRAYAGGVDSIQALLLALAMVGEHLKVESDQGDPLKFVGGDALGLPTISVDSASETPNVTLVTRM
jgi:hypothetical protein